MNKNNAPINEQKQYTFEENSPLYVLDLDLLEPGDIILTREKTVTSIAVRTSTLGTYSHAIICVSNDSAIESTVDGKVFSLNTQRLVFHKKNDCIVLRSKTLLSKNQLLNMDRFLRLKTATPYSIKEAVKVPINKNTLNIANDSKQFCSRLVAQAYSHIGINLVKNPDYCSPSDLGLSNHLMIVPNAIRLATQNDIKVINKPNMVEENRKQTYAWLEPTIMLAQTIGFEIIAQNDVDLFLLKYPRFDRKVCEYIQKTRYLTQYKDDEIANPIRYKYDSLYAPTKIDIRNEIHQITGIFNDKYQSYIAIRHNYKLTPLRYNKLLKNLYRNLLKHLILRLNVLSEYAKNSQYDVAHELYEIQKLTNLISKTLQ